MSSIQQKNFNSQQSKPKPHSCNELKGEISGEAEDKITHKDVKGKSVVDEFREGDKLYGIALLGKGRTRYINEIRKRFPEANIIIDDLSNQFVCTGKFTGKNDTYYKDQIEPRGEEAQEFQKFIQARYPKYDPSNAPGLNSEPELQYKSPRDVELVQKLLALLANRASYKRVGRSSKAGIAFIAERGKKVHFVLDDLDSGAAAQKISGIELLDNIDADDIKLHKSSRGGVLKDITAQELRFIFRNWDNDKIWENVTFWKGGKRVDAPWKSNEEVDVYARNQDSGLFEATTRVRLKELWQEYKNQVQAKHVDAPWKSNEEVDVYARNQDSGLFEATTRVRLKELWQGYKNQVQAKHVDPSSVSTSKAVSGPRTNLNNVSITSNSTELTR